MNFQNDNLIHADSASGDAVNPGSAGQYVTYSEQSISRDLAGGGGGGGNGGDGGNGGIVDIIYANLISSGTVRALGGPGGNGAAGGTGDSTYYQAGTNSFNEQGALGSGGDGGHSQNGDVPSTSGSPGMIGNAGFNGMVTLTQAIYCFLDLDTWGDANDAGS